MTSDGVTAPRRQLTTTGSGYQPDAAKGEALSTTWEYDFRNRDGTGGKWKRTRFGHMGSGPVPTTRDEALAILSDEVKRWVPDTELRLVETVETVMSDPIHHPDRERQADAGLKSTMEGKNP